MNNRIAKNLAQLKPGTLFVGIDIGKARHTVSILISGGRPAGVLYWHANAALTAQLARVISLTKYYWQEPAVVTASHIRCY